jgi:hypothetical protein
MVERVRFEQHVGGVAMLDFTPKKAARNWTSRREQRKLLVLVALVAGVIVAASMAREPRLYNWIADIGKMDDVEDAHVDTRLNQPRRESDVRRGIFAISAEAPADTHANVPAGDRFPRVKMEYFQAIKDNTIHRPSEADAWFHLLDIANKTAQETLEQASRGRVTFLQLFRQPDLYRAELVTVAGTVHRVVSQKITDNYVGLEGEYYQIWLQPKNSAHPVVVYSLGLPAGFPVGMELREPAEVTGFFFKIWAYPAHDEPRTAPILLAKTVRWNEERVKRTFASPGASAAPEADSKPTKVTQSPQTYLAEHWNITVPVWERFVDGKPLANPTRARDDEPATLLKLLNNLSRLPEATVAAWTNKTTLPMAVAENPDVHRGQFFSFEGRAVRCERVDLPEDLASLFDFESVFRTEIHSNDDGAVRIVYSTSAPRGWLRDADGKPLPANDIDEQTAAVAMFVKVGGDIAAEGQAARPSLVYVAKRLAWHPDSLLGGLGMDMALFDDLTQGAEVGGGEAECLYDLLANSAPIDRQELNEIARERQFAMQKDFEYEYQFPNIPSNSFILNEVRARPEKNAGTAVSLTATALQAFRVRLKPEDAAKYGFDHYYHINASVPLDPPITIIERRKQAPNGDPVAKNGDTQNTGKQQTRDDMSVVFCVRHLPEGFPQGEKITAQITVPGFFFKTWAATSEKSAEKVALAKQHYPMFVADTVIWTKPTETRNWLGSAIVGVLVGMLVLGGVGAWVSRRGNYTLDQTLARQRTNIDTPLDSLDLPTTEKPDFSFLAAHQGSHPTVRDGDLPRDGAQPKDSSPNSPA